MRGRGDQAKSSGIVGRMFLTLFFAIFLAVGAGMFASIVPDVIRNAATYGWNRVPCEIIESRITTADTVEEGSAGWHVRYRYTIDGRDHVGTMLSAGRAVGDARDDLRRSQQLAPGTRTDCFVNPADPTDAVLERRSLWTLLVPLFPLIFVAVGAGGIWITWARRSPEKPVEGLTERLRSRATSERRGLVVGMLFGGVFLVVGLVLTHLFVVQPLRGMIAARDWPEVPCEIVSSEVAEHDSDDGTTYSVELTYRYGFDGRVYLSNRYRFVQGSSSGYASKARFVRRHPPGTRATCFVNPADPTEAVFDRGWSGMMWFGLIPIAFALVGGAMVVGMFVHWRRPAPVGGLRAATGAAARRRVGRAAARAVVPELPDADDPAGPVVLEPTATRGMKLFGAVLVAAFWNGILSVFLVQLLRGDGDGFSWFLALFLTPFVLVGLGLIGMAGRQVLGLSNPVARLTLDSRVLRPGGGLDLAWELRGRVRVLRRLRIFLEGREEATYRRGTDTTTDRAVFATHDLVDTTDPHAIASGRAGIRLPPRLMHTFTAKNNKIVWSLKVKGEIPRWPDLDEEFSVTVAPVAPAGEGGGRG